MTRVPQLEFANVIIRFGDELEMIDLFEQVVLPAFERKDLHRKSRGTDYFFLDVVAERLVEDDAGSFAIIGRLVKNTTLVVEQVWNEEEQRLVPTPQRIPSSPSALFAFRIQDHKLLWLHEKTGAPTLSVFEATLRNFLKDTYEDFIKNELQRRVAAAQERDEPIPKATDVRALFPRPSIEVVTLASEASLEQFLRQFSILTSVTIEFLVPNAELDNDGLFEGIRSRQADIGSKNTKLSHSNPTGNGLNKDEALRQLAPAAEQANSRIKLVGKDAQGDKLRGNEEKFSVSVPMPQVDGNIVKAARSMERSLNGLVQSGTIAFGKLSDRVREESRNVIRRLERH